MRTPVRACAVFFTKMVAQWKKPLQNLAFFLIEWTYFF
ncbi:hypothetical protein IV71_GL000395 [Fructobacillus fructosus KCTC 3544]|nr:hypothetical protein IV71_GL000395 [Fructobacillus fructosus KCTC 3544]